MKRLLLGLSLAAFLVLPGNLIDARGRGGGGISRGGGGGISRGGGGGFSRPAPRPSTPTFNRPAARPSTPTFNRPTTRPSTPSFNRPATRPSLPSTKPSTRPSLPSTRPSTRPNLPSSKPDIGANRPNLPSQRPSIKPDTRPNLTPGTRPSLPGTGTRPGLADRPTTRPGTNLPGTGTRPATGGSKLPGLGSGTRPGIADRPSQLPSRPTISDRKADLNNRFRDRDSFRDNNININNINRTEINNRWQNNRANWNDRWQDRHWYHDHWYHGHCHWGWSPGYMWRNYPVLTAFGVTTWAINRWNWASGYYSYYNPYATPVVINQSASYYDYSQPIQVASDDVDTAPAPPEEVLSAFDRATQEFKTDQFLTALNSVNEALKQSPNDAAMHEFRALCLFALGRYDEAAATLYAVLGVGPGWDWTTMISLYSSVDVYTPQLRKLEEFTKSNPQSASSRFVLAYHYITQGHEDAAARQLTEVVKLQPKDTLARDLLLGINPDADIPKPEVVQPPKPTQKVNSESLEGTWTAERAGGDKFTMTLNDEGKFTWTYQNGDQKQDVTGVWAVDDDGILALDMGEDDTIVAQLDPQGNSQLDFYMVGDTQGAEPLHFKK